MDPQLLAQLFDTFSAETQNMQLPWNISAGDSVALDNQGDYIRFESNGREWRVLQMGASEDETNVPPYRGDTQLRDAVRALPPVCFAPLVSQYTRLLRDPRWEVRHVPRMMEAMLNDRVLFNLMDTSPLSVLSESRVSAMTRWWGVLGKPVLRYENSTGRPLMTLVDGYESVSGASPGASEGQQRAARSVETDASADGIDEQPSSVRGGWGSDTAAAPAPSAAKANPPRMSLEEVRQGYRDIKTVLTLIAATSAPYRCSRPPNASVSGCTARIVFCKDPSTIYLGLLLNSVLRGLPRKVLCSMSVFRLIAEGWGSSPSFADILHAAWEEYSYIMCEIRELLGLPDPTADATSSAAPAALISSFSCVLASTSASSSAPLRQQSLRRQGARRRLLPPMRLPVQHSDSSGQSRHSVSQQSVQSVAAVSASSSTGGRPSSGASSSAAILPHTTLRQTRPTGDNRLQAVELMMPVRNTADSGPRGTGDERRQSTGNNTGDANDLVTVLLGNALSSLTGLQSRRNASNGSGAGQGMTEAAGAGGRADEGDAPLGSHGGINSSEHGSTTFRTEDANAICHESMLECSQNPELLLWWARCRLLAYQLLDNPSRMSVESTGALEYFREVWTCTPLIREILEDDQGGLLTASFGASLLSPKEAHESEEVEADRASKRARLAALKERARRIYATLVGAIADLSKFWFSVRVAQSTVNAVASRAPETNTVWSIVNAAVPSRRRFQREEFTSYAEHWQYALLVDDYVTQPMCFRVSTRGRTMVTQLLHILSEYPTFYPALVARTLAMLNRREMIVAELNERLVNAVARCLRFYLPPMPPAPGVPKAQVAPPSVAARTSDAPVPLESTIDEFEERLRGMSDSYGASFFFRELLSPSPLPQRSRVLAQSEWMDTEHDDEEGVRDEGNNRHRGSGGIHAEGAAAALPPPFPPPPSTSVPYAGGGGGGDGDGDTSARGGVDYEALVSLDPAEEVDYQSYDEDPLHARRRAKILRDGAVRLLSEEEAKMPVITVKAYEAILTCLDVLRMLVRNAHISVNPMNLLFTVPAAAAATSSAPTASSSPQAPPNEEVGGNTDTGSTTGAEVAGHSPVHTSAMGADRKLMRETSSRSQCDLYTLLEQLVYQTRYGPLASAALRLFSVCVHYNVRDMVPLFAERGLLNTVLTIARRPRFVSEDAATLSTPLLFKLDMVDENGRRDITPHGLAQSTSAEASSSLLPLLVEHPPPGLLARYIPAEDAYLNDVAVRIVIPEFVEAMTVHKATHSVFSNHTEWITAITRGLTVTPAMSGSEAVDIEALFDELVEVAGEYEADVTDTGDDAAIWEGSKGHHTFLPVSQPVPTARVSADSQVDHVRQMNVREDRLLRCRSSAAYEQLMRELHAYRQGKGESHPAPTTRVSSITSADRAERLQQRDGGVPDCRAGVSSIDVALTRMVELHRLHLKREEVTYKTLQGSVKEMQRVLTEVLHQSSLITGSLCSALRAELSSLSDQTREFVRAVRMLATEPHPLWRRATDGAAEAAAGHSTTTNPISSGPVNSDTRQKCLRLLLRATEVCRTLNNFFAFFSAFDFDGPQRRHWLSRRNPEHEASYQELESVLMGAVREFHFSVNQLWSLMGSHAPLKLLDLDAEEAADVATTAEEQRSQSALDEGGAMDHCGHTLPTRIRLGSVLEVYEQGNADGASSLLSYVQATVGPYLHARIFGEYLRSVPSSSRLEETLRSTVKCILHFSSRDFIAEPEVAMPCGGGGDEPAIDADGAMSKAMRRRCLKAMKRVLEGRRSITQLHGSMDSISQRRRGSGLTVGEDRATEGDVGDCASDSAEEGPVAERVRYFTSESPCKDVISSVLRPLSVGDGAFLRQLLEAWRVSRSGSSGGGGGGVNGSGRREGDGAMYRGLFSEVMECVVDALVVRAPYTSDEVTNVLRSLQAGLQHSSVSTGILSLYDRNAEAGATVSSGTSVTLTAGVGVCCSSDGTDATTSMDPSDQILQSMLQDNRFLLGEPSTAWMTKAAWVQATTSTAQESILPEESGSSLSPASAAVLPRASDACPVARTGAAAAGGAFPSIASPHSAFSAVVVPSVLANPRGRRVVGSIGGRGSLGGLGHGGDSDDSVDSSAALSLSPSTTPPPLGLVTNADGVFSTAERITRYTNEEGNHVAVGGSASSATAAPPQPAPPSLPTPQQPQQPPPTQQPLFTPVNAAKALQHWTFLSLFTGRRSTDQPTRNFFYLSPYRRDNHVRPALPLSVSALLRTILKDLHTAFEDAVCSVSADASSADSIPGVGESRHSQQLHSSRSRMKQRNRHSSDNEVTPTMADSQERLHTVRPQPRHSSRTGVSASNDSGGNSATASTRAHKGCVWFGLDSRALVVVKLPSSIDVEGCLRGINFAAARRVLWELAVLGSVCAGGNGSMPEWESASMQDMLTSVMQFMILLSRLFFSDHAVSATNVTEAPGESSTTFETAAATPAPLSQAAAALKDQLQRYLVYMAVLVMNFLECSDARTRGRHCHHVESLLYCILDVWPSLPGFPMVPHMYVAAMEAIAQLKPDTLSRMSFRALSRQWQDTTENSASVTVTADAADRAETLPNPPSPHLDDGQEAHPRSDPREGEEEDGGHVQDSREGTSPENTSGGAGPVSQSPEANSGSSHHIRATPPSPRSALTYEQFFPILARIQQSTRSQLNASLSAANEWSRALPWVCNVAAGQVFPLDTLSEAGYRLLRKRVCRALWNMWSVTTFAEQQYVVAYILHRVLSNVRDNVVLLEYVGVLLSQLRGVVLVEALALTQLPRAIVKAVHRAIEEVAAEQHAEEARLQTLNCPSDPATAAAQREYRQRRRRYYARTQMVLHGQLVSFLSVFQSVRSDAPLVAYLSDHTALAQPQVQTMGMQCSYFDATRNTFCWCGHQCHRQHVVPVNGQRGRDSEEHRFALNAFGEGTQRVLDEVISVLEHHGFPYLPDIAGSTTPARGTSCAEGAASENQAMTGPYVSSAASVPAQGSGHPQAHRPPQRVVRVPSPAGTVNPNPTQGPSHNLNEVPQRTWRREQMPREHLSTTGSVPADTPGQRGDASRGDHGSASAGRRAGLSPEALVMVEAIGMENYVRLLRGEGLPWVPRSSGSAQPSPSSSRQARGGSSAPAESGNNRVELDEEALDVLTHFSAAFGLTPPEGSSLRHRLLNPLTSAELRSDPLPRSIIPHFALFGRDVCEEVMRMSLDFIAARLRDEEADRVDAEAERDEQHLLLLQQQQPPPPQYSIGSVPLSAVAGDSRSVDGVLSTPPQFPSSPVASPVSAATLPFVGVPPTSAAPVSTAKGLASRLVLPRVEVVECSVGEVMIHFLLICFSTYYNTCMHLVRTHRPAGSSIASTTPSAVAGKSTSLASSSGTAADVTGGYTGSLGVMCAYITQLDTPDNEKATLLSGLLLTDMARLEEDVWQQMVTVLQTTVQVHQQGQRLTEKAYAALMTSHRLTRASMGGAPVASLSPSRTAGKACVAANRKGCSHRRPHGPVHVSPPSATVAVHSAPSQPAEAMEEELYSTSGTPGTAKSGEVAEAATAAHHYLIPLSIFLANLELYIIRHPIAFYHAFCRYCEVRWVRAAAGEVPAAWLGVWVRPRPQTAGAPSAGVRGHGSRATRRFRSGAVSTLSHDFVERVQCFMQYLTRNVESFPGRTAQGATVLSSLLQLPGVFEALLSPNFQIPVPTMYAEFLTSTAAAHGTTSSFAEAAAGSASVFGGGEGEHTTSVECRGGGDPATPASVSLNVVPPFLAIALYLCPALVGTGRNTTTTTSSATTSNGGGAAGGGRHTAAGNVDFATALFIHDPIAVSEAVVRTLKALVAALEVSSMSDTPTTVASSQTAAGSANERITSSHRAVNEEAVAVSTHESVAAPATSSAVSPLEGEEEQRERDALSQQQQQQQQQRQLETKETFCRLKKSFTRCLHDVLCFLERGSPLPAVVALPARQRATSQHLGVNSVVHQTFLRFFEHLGRLGLLEILFRVCRLQSCEHGRDATSLLQLLGYQLLAMGEFRLAESLSPLQRRYAEKQGEVLQDLSAPRDDATMDQWVDQRLEPLRGRPGAVALRGENSDTLARRTSLRFERTERGGQHRAFDQSGATRSRVTTHGGAEGDGDARAPGSVQATATGFATDANSGLRLPDTQILTELLSFEEVEEGQEEWNVVASDYESAGDHESDNGNHTDSSSSSSSSTESSGEFDGGVGHDEEAPSGRAGGRDTWPPIQPVRHTGSMRFVQSSGGNEEVLSADVQPTVQRRSSPQALSPSASTADATVERIFENLQRSVSATGPQRMSSLLMSRADGAVRGSAGDSEEEYAYRRPVTLETYEDAVLRSLRAEDAMERHRHYGLGTENTEAATEVDYDVDYSNPDEHGNALYADAAVSDSAGAEENIDRLFRSEPEGSGFFVPPRFSIPQVGASGDRRRGGNMEEDEDDALEGRRDSDSGNSERDLDHPVNEEYSEDEEDEEDETYGDDDDDDEGEEGEEEEGEDTALLYYDGTGNFLSAGEDRQEDAAPGVYAPETAAEGGEAGTLRHGTAQQMAVGFSSINGQSVMSTRAIGAMVERAPSFAACAYRAILLAVRPLAAHNVADTEIPPLPVLHATEEEAPKEVPEPEASRRDSCFHDSGANPLHQLSVEGHEPIRGAGGDVRSGPSQRNLVASRDTTTVSRMSALLQQRSLPTSTRFRSPLSVEGGHVHTPSDQLMRRGRDSHSPLEGTGPRTTRRPAEGVSLTTPSLTAVAVSHSPPPAADPTPGAGEARAQSEELNEASEMLESLTTRILELFAVSDNFRGGASPGESLPSALATQGDAVASEQAANTGVTTDSPATPVPVQPAAPEPWEGILNPQFLIEMPEDVRSEILFDSMNVLRSSSEREVRGQRTRLYPGFLEALPEDARRHAMEVEARWVRVTGADNNANELYQTLLLVDAETRRDLLLQCDLELLRSYPEVLREATELRAEVERAREEAELAAQREQERRQRQREQAAQLLRQSDQRPRGMLTLFSWDNLRDSRGGGAAPPPASGVRTNLSVLESMNTVEGVTRVLFGATSQLYEVLNYELFSVSRRYRCEAVLHALDPPTSWPGHHAAGPHGGRAATGEGARSSGLVLSPLRDEDETHGPLGLGLPRSSNRGGHTLIRRAPPRGAPMAAAGAAAASSRLTPIPLPSLQLPPSADPMSSNSAAPPSSALPHPPINRGGDGSALEGDHSASRSTSVGAAAAAAAVPSTSLAALSESMVPVQESVHHSLALPLPHVSTDIVSRCIELLRLRSTAPLALPNNRLTSVSCLDEELQRVMQLLMSSEAAATRIACQLLDLMASTPTMMSTEDVFPDGAVGTVKSSIATVNTTAAARVSPFSLSVPSLHSARTLSTSQLAANRQFIKDATMLFVSLVKQNQSMVASFFLLPDGAVDTSTLKSLDAPLDEVEQRVADCGLWNRLWRVARQHVHVPSFMLALDKLLQQLLRCQRSMLMASDDNEVSSTADPNGNEPLTESLVEHPRHPHRLQWTNIRLLSNYEEGGYLCNICGTNPGFDYCFHCSSCQFDLCANCSRERLTLAEMQKRMRRAAARMLQHAPETVKSMMRLLRHPLCRSDTAMSVVQLMSLGLQECGSREGVGMFSGDVAGSLHGGGPSVSPIQILEEELVELADSRVRAMKIARDEFRQEVHAILQARPNGNATATGVSVAAPAPSRPQLGTGTSSSGFSSRPTWQQLRIPEGYIFDTDTVMALLVKLDIKNSEGDVIPLLFEPYVATMRSEPRAFTMLWRASQAYLLDVSTLLEHVTPKEMLPLPSCVSSILQTFCKYHLSESRLLGTSASARALTDSRTSLSGETEHFLRASTNPSSVSDRAVRELAEQPDAAQCMTAAGTRLSEEGPKSSEELLHRRLPRVVRMLLEDNRTTLNTLLYWDGNLIKNAFSFLKYEPNLIDFHFKLSDFRQRLGMRRGPNILLRVNRQTCLLDSFKELQKVKSFGGQLHIRFHGEEGADAGGLTREWLKLLSEALVDESYALFIHSQDGMSFQPNPFSSVNHNHLEYFQFAGVVTGLAIAHNVPIDIHFTRAFYRHIIGHRPVFSDLQSFDPELYTNLNWIMENDVTDLGLTFAVNYDRFGSVEEEELEPSGKDKTVTNANKQQYVRLLCEFHMTRRTEDQLLRFLKGFYAVIPRREIQCFTEKELELVISGMPNIDIEDLRTHTVYEGYSSTSPQVRWFWEAVGSMSKEDLANLLQFTTGSSKVPHGGFGHLEGSNGRSLPFTISRWAVSKDDLLPQAHTCFNKIDLPVYSTAAVLREKLMLAITYGSMGFTMV